MLELRALAAEDGWAFVRWDDRTLLVRPPYERVRMVEVGPDSVSKAIGAHGFRAESRAFEGWSELIEHLRSEVVSANRDRPALDRPAQRLLQKAPRPTLERFLDRVERDLIPRGEWRAAVEIVEALLSLDSVMADADLRRRSSDLLKAAVAGVARQRQARIQFTDDASDLEHRFPRMARRYSEGAVRTYLDKARTHRILPMAG